MKKILTFIMSVMLLAIGASSVSAYATYPITIAGKGEISWNIHVKTGDIVTIDRHTAWGNLASSNLMVNDVETPIASNTTSRIIQKMTMISDSNILKITGKGSSSIKNVIYSVLLNGVDVNEIEIGTPPPIPANFRETEVKSGTVSMMWDSITGIADLAGYNVYRNGTKINTTPIKTTNYTFNNVPDDVIQRWQVTSLRIVSTIHVESDKSTEVSTFFDTEPPVPQNLSAVGGMEKINLNWSDVNIADFAGYNVYQNDVKINGSLIKDTRYSSNNIAAGEYRYQVTTVDQTGNESERSDTVTATVTEKVPVAPLNLKAESVSEVLKLNWSENSEASVIGYKLYVDNLLLTTLNKDITTFDLVGLESGRNYSISLAAYTAAGTHSERSTITAKLLDTTPPDNVKNFIALAGNASAALYWTANKEKDLAGYNIYVDGVLHTTVAKHVVSTLIKNLTNDTEYKINITAIDTSGNESERSATFIVTPNGLADITAPAKPIGLVGVAGGKEIVLNWTANTELDLVGYFVYLDNVKVNYAPIENTDFVISNLELDTKYRIYVTAIDTSGNESASSNVINVMTAARSAPVDLKAKKEEQQVILSWKAPKSQPDHYIIYKNGIRITETTDLEFLDAALETGQSYKYEVSAMYADGESKKSSVGVRMSSGNDLVFDDVTLGQKVLDALLTAVNFIKQNVVWVLLVVGILFAKHIWSFILWILDIMSGNAKRRKLAEAAEAKKKKEEQAEKRRVQARERRINKRRDERYSELTRTGHITQRDKWVREVNYMNPEQRKERVRQQRVENLSKAREARSQRTSNNRSRSKGSGTRNRRKSRTVRA